jgi:cytochrome c-type biogenesis protein CcmH
MTLWLIFAVMTAAAMLAVVWPLVRSTAVARSGSDVAVYRDQLDEVERDLRAGLIGQSEAEAARVEISRRLLTAADAAQAGPPDSNVAAAIRRRRTAAVASLVALPIVAASLYLPLGSPELGAPDGESVQSRSPSKASSPRLRRISGAIPRTAAAGRFWPRSICVSTVTRAR